MTEKTTISTPTYLFVFKSDNTNVEYPVISTDLATEAEKVRYNEFTIIEGVDDPENGSVVLGATGTYHYFVYAQSSTTNLDPDLADEIVERGSMLLITAGEASNYIENNIDVVYAVN